MGKARMERRLRQCKTESQESTWLGSEVLGKQYVWCARPLFLQKKFLQGSYGSQSPLTQTAKSSEQGFSKGPGGNWCQKQPKPWRLYTIGNSNRRLVQPVSLFPSAWEWSLVSSIRRRISGGFTAFLSHGHCLIEGVPEFNFAAASKAGQVQFGNCAQAKLCHS